MSTIVYRAETEKSVEQFVIDFTELVQGRGFVLHNDGKMAMKDVFNAHGHVVGDDFDLHMVQVCKPEKAAKSLSVNPERSVLMPKFIMVFGKDGKTQVRMLRYGKDLIAELVNDDAFPDSLQETFDNLSRFIEEAI